MPGICMFLLFHPFGGEGSITKKLVDIRQTHLLFEKVLLHGLAHILSHYYQYELLHQSLDFTHLDTCFLLFSRSEKKCLLKGD